MPRESWSDDEEDWSETDDDLAAAEAVSCPECGAAIYDDLDHCPRCNYWLTDADHQALDGGYFSSRRVRLVALFVLIVFVIVLLAGSGAFF
jgi:uncharacterized paraquat-inducible protein A